MVPMVLNPHGIEPTYIKLDLSYYNYELKREKKSV